MILTRFKHTKTSVLGIFKDDVGGTYFTIENANTIIPCGTYKVSVCHSQKFGRDLPLLYNDIVGADRGIRVHGGKKYTDSKGCVIIGNNVDLVSMSIGDSTRALEQLIRNCGKELEINGF